LVWYLHHSPWGKQLIVNKNVLPERCTLQERAQPHEPHANILDATVVALHEEVRVVRDLALAALHSVVFGVVVPAGQCVRLCTATTEQVRGVLQVVEVGVFEQRFVGALKGRGQGARH
jgi:hypothetical protein